MRKRNKIMAAAVISVLLCGCGNTAEYAEETAEKLPAVITDISDMSVTETENVTSSENKILTEAAASAISENSAEIPNVPHETISSAGAAASDTSAFSESESTVFTVTEEISISAAETSVTVIPAVTAPPQTSAVTTVPSAVTSAAVTTTAIPREGNISLNDVTFADYFSDSLFIGDSICSGLKIYGGLLNVENCAARINVSTWGINKYKFQYKKNSSAELDALSIVKLYQPKKIYIWMGMNDLYVVSETKYAQNLCDLALLYKEADPGCKVYAVSISPMSSTHKWNVTMDGNNRINLYNKTVREKCEEVDYLEFVNVHDCLMDKYGFLASENDGGDGLHLSSGAYKKVLTEIFYFSEYQNKMETMTVSETETEISEETTELSLSETEETVSETTAVTEETESVTVTAPPIETTVSVTSITAAPVSAVSKTESTVSESTGKPKKTSTATGETVTETKKKKKKETETQAEVTEETKKKKSAETETHTETTTPPAEEE